MNYKKTIHNMTIEEKAAFLSGKSEWETRAFHHLEIPSIFCADGPNGLRKQAGTGDHLGINPSVPATCFPTAAGLANSWDVQLGEEVGKALGEEALEEDVQVLLGPGLNIKRNPLCGRNFEYFSEDPYLSGKMAAALISGIQSKGVAACAKHFAVNSQELRRMAMNSVIDERTLREIYLTGFEIAVKEGNVKSIMSSYNEVNGIYANENRHLLMDILRKEWGFDGVVITDWGASNDHVKGVKNGANLEMPLPGLECARELIAAVESGKLNEQDIDDRVEELLEFVVPLAQQSKEYHEIEKNNLDKKKMYEEHHELARRACAESAVLLKNSDHLLPLRTNMKVAIIGDFAMEPRYQGAGSSMVNSARIDAIKDVVGNYDLQIIGMCKGYQRNGDIDDRMKKEAIDLADKADVVLYFFGLNEQSESEGLDRLHMRIPQNQIQLMQELSKSNENMVGIISAGAVVEMPWHYHFKALLHGYLTGQAGAGAIMDILTGKINPSGKLNETYIKQYEDTPSYNYFPAQERNSEYREGIYVGYRYFDTAKVPVLYPFGHGLSYTSFEYQQLEVDKKGIQCTIKNAGRCDGAEIVQLYVGLKEAKVFRPTKELKGFTKIFLKAGEERQISIPFDDKTFRYWNAKTNQWEIEGGEYQIMLGSSAGDIRQYASLQVEGTTMKFPYYTNRVYSYFTGKIQKVDDEEYTGLLGFSIPDGRWSGELGINDAICQMYYAKSKLARLIYKKMTERVKKSEESGVPDLNALFQYNMPFRAIGKMTAGMVSMEMVESIVMIVNGHFVKGLFKTIGGFFTNQHRNKQYEKKLKRRGKMGWKRNKNL